MNALQNSAICHHFGFFLDLGARKTFFNEIVFLNIKKVEDHYFRIIEAYYSLFRRSCTSFCQSKFQFNSIQQQQALLLLKIPYVFLNFYRPNGMRKEKVFRLFFTKKQLFLKVVF